MTRAVNGLRDVLNADRFVLPALLLLIAVYLVPRVDTGWIPHDEGTIGQTAERVLDGQLPHRDFDDSYTGGLAILNSFAFRVAGVNPVAPRWVLFGFSLAFFVVVYRIARFAAPPWLAGLVTLLCMAWSVPNYFAALPSWYNLFFAAFGTLALFRYIDTGKVRWVFLAGIAGGISLLFKSVGAYYVAAGLLFLVFSAQNEAEEGADSGPRWSRWVVRAGLAGFCLALIALVRRTSGAMEIIHFVLPGVALATALVANDVRIARSGRSCSMMWLFRTGALFLAGVGLPLVLFATPYIVSGSLHDLLYGVFVAPMARLASATHVLPRTVTLIAALPAAVLLGAPLVYAGRLERARTWILATIVAAAGLVLGGSQFIYVPVWWSVRPLAPIVCLVVGLIIGSRFSQSMAVDRKERLFLLAAICAMVSLVQFPFPFGVYFCYAAPMVALAILFLVDSRPRSPKRLLAVGLGFYLLFAVLWLNTGWIYTIGKSYERDASNTTLRIRRGELTVLEADNTYFTSVVREIQERSADASSILATPDCPEIYFLSGRRNPTRILYEFLDRDFQTDRALYRRTILDTLERDRVQVVVVNLRPEFSGRLDAELARELSHRFPYSRTLLPKFVVRWRQLPPLQRDATR